MCVCVCFLFCFFVLCFDLLWFCLFAFCVCVCFFFLVNIFYITRFCSSGGGFFVFVLFVWAFFKTVLNVTIACVCIMLFSPTLGEG